jgi:hypothetical protein
MGKARVAQNGRRKQVEELSRREVQRNLSGLDATIEKLAEIRRQLLRDFG